MRFSYIDSSGKEVALESVEALALRVQIGAIRPDTRLYDASADRWAPAEEHPIYQNLVSSSGGPKGRARPGGAGGGAGAGAAPSAPAGGGDAEGGAAAGPGGLDWEELQSEPAEPEAEAAEAVEPEPAEPEPEPEPEPDEPAEPEPSEPEPSEPEPSEPEPSEPEPAEDDVGWDELALEPEVPATQASAEAELPEEPGVPSASEEAEAVAPPEESEEDEAPSFDMEGGLQLEEPDETEEEEGLEEEPEPDEAGPGLVEDAGTEEEPAVAPGAGDGGGLELADMAGELGWEMEEAEPEDVAATGAGADAAGERPKMRDPNPFGPDEPEPAPTDAPERDRPTDEGRDAAAAGATTTGAEDAAGAGADAAEGPDGVAVPGRPQAPRPEHWEGRKVGARRSRTPLLVAIFLLAAAAGGGAWYFLAGPGAAGPAEAEGPPPAPPLPESLAPAMAAVGGEAYASFLAWTDEVRAEADLPAAPGPQWLEGRYFAGASGYPQVRLFWDAWDGYVERLRSDEGEVFRSGLDRALESGEAVAEADRPVLRDRIVWEFERAAEAREEAYASVGDLSSAALDFHDLLVRREEEIRYDPASSGVARDPILEVTTSDALLRSEMNEHIDRVLRAIARSGAEAPITSEGMTSALRTGLERADPFGG